MKKRCTINLRGHIPSTSGVEFLEAQWSEGFLPPAPGYEFSEPPFTLPTLMRISCALRGETQPEGLILDQGKGFLGVTDQAFVGAAVRISRFILLNKHRITKEFMR